MNKTASLAVIPGGPGKELTNDPEIVKFLLKHHCELEIMIHGYDNTDAEFENLTYSSASDKIDKGLEILNPIEKDIITFVPPSNLFSDETKIALQKHGIKFVSAGSLDEPFGFDTSPYDWTNHRLRTIEEMVNGCENAINKTGVCVVMIHPQDFVNDKGKTDPDKYSEFIGMIDGLDTLNASFVNFRDFQLNGTISLS